jgi:hypothetical protein
MDRDETLDNRNAPTEVPVANATNQPAIKWGWLRVVLLLPVWMIISQVAAAVIAFAFGVRSGADYFATLETPAGIMIQLAALLGTALPIWLFTKFVDRRSFMSLGWQFGGRYAKDLVSGMAWGIGLISSIFLVLYLTGGLTITDLQMPGLPFLYISIAMVMVAMAEELLVRGYLLTNFMDSMSKYAALIVSSLLFAAAHMLNPNTSWLGIANIVLAGLVLGIYYVHQRNLWFPIGMHFTWNLFQGSVLGSPISGVKVSSIVNIELTGSDLLTGGSFGFEASLVTTVILLIATLMIHLIFRKPPVQAAATTSAEPS